MAKQAVGWGRRGSDEDRSGTGGGGGRVVDGRGGGGWNRRGGWWRGRCQHGSCREVKQRQEKTKVELAVVRVVSSV